LIGHRKFHVTFLGPNLKSAACFASKETFQCVPKGPTKGGFWPDDFAKKFSPRFHVFLNNACPTVLAKRGAGSCDAKSGLVIHQPEGLPIRIYGMGTGIVITIT